MIGMRPIWASAWSILTVICLAGVRANAETEYFPPRAFVLVNPPNGGKDISGMLADQYSEYLRRIDEPSLWKQAREDGRLDAYRFLWLPGFDASYRPVAVRIEKAGRRVSLIVVQLGRDGDEDAGKIVLSKQMPLNQDQWNRLTKLVGRANFWDMPARIDDLGFDVETLLVEGAKDGEYHVVVRHSPEPGAYRELCRYMLDLTGPDMGQQGWPAPPPSRAGMWVLVGFLALCFAALLVYAVLRWVICPRKPGPSRRSK
jgi:hypothetical protein